jgi:hypothetical protein
VKEVIKKKGKGRIRFRSFVVVSDVVSAVKVEAACPLRTLVPLM